jgi:hypothetical protein
MVLKHKKDNLQDDQIHLESILAEYGETITEKLTKELILLKENLIFDNILNLLSIK